MKLLIAIIIAAIGIFLCGCAGFPKITGQIGYTTADGQTITVGSDGKTIVVGANFRQVQKLPSGYSK